MSVGIKGLNFEVASFMGLVHSTAKTKLGNIGILCCIQFLKTLCHTGWARLKYSNTVNSNFHPIRSFCEIFAKFLLLHV